jgi:hypothetical protein
MTAGFFVAADGHPRNTMIWAGDPNPEVDPTPRPMLARYDIVSTEDDAAGKELWQLIVDAVARHSGAAKVHTEMAQLRLLRDGGAA